MNLSKINQELEMQYRHQELEAWEQYNNIATKQSLIDLGIEII